MYTVKYIIVAFLLILSGCAGSLDIDKMDQEQLSTISYTKVINERGSGPIVLVSKQPFGYSGGMTMGCNFALRQGRVFIAGTVMSANNRDYWICTMPIGADIRTGFQDSSKH